MNGVSIVSKDPVYAPAPERTRPSSSQLPGLAGDNAPPGSPAVPKELARYLDELRGDGKAHSLMCLSVYSFNKLKDRYGSAAQD